MNYLNYFPIVVLFLLIDISPQLFAQSNVEEINPISNVQLFKENENIIVNYDVVGLGKRDRLVTKITFDYDGEVVYPSSLSGNGIGKVRPGNDKKIIWNPIADDYELNEDSYLDPIIDAKIRRFGGGRANALWGIIPSIGHKRVNTKDDQTTHFSSTVLAWSLVGSGIASKLISMSIYDKYDNVYESPFHKKLAQPYYNRANNFHKAYIGLLSSGVFIMLAEGVMIYRKGAKNDKALSKFDGNKSKKKRKRKKKRRSKALLLVPQNNGLSFHYSLNF